VGNIATHSSMANVSMMLMYQKVDETNDHSKIISFQPNCNMRPVSEVNMTCKLHSGQVESMENILKARHGTQRLLLNSSMKVVLFETIETSNDDCNDEDTADLISSAVCEIKKNTSKIIKLRKIRAKAITNRTLTNAIAKMQIGHNNKEGTNVTMIILFLLLVEFRVT